MICICSLYSLQFSCKYTKTSDNAVGSLYVILGSTIPRGSSLVLTKDMENERLDGLKLIVANISPAASPCLSLANIISKEQPKVEKLRHLGQKGTKMPSISFEP